VTQLRATEVRALLDGCPVSREEEATIRAELDAAARRMGVTRAALTIEEAVRQVKQ